MIIFRAISVVKMDTKCTYIDFSKKKKIILTKFNPRLYSTCSDYDSWKVISSGIVVPRSYIHFMYIQLNAMSTFD